MKKDNTTQIIRIADVVVIAPILLIAGTQKGLPAWLRVSLMGIALATAIYNGSNYIRIEMEKANNSEGGGTDK